MNWPPYDGGPPGYDGRPQVPCPPVGVLGNIYQRENGARANLAPQVSTTIAPVRRTLIELSGENDPSPQAVIASLYRKNVGAIPARALPFLVRARITWGAGKQKNEVLLDYQHGTRICIDASSLRVDAEYLCVGDEVEELGPTVSCGVSLVYGNIGSQATLTEVPVEVAAAGTSAFFPIPDFAREVMFLSLADPAGVNQTLTFSSDLANPQVVVNTTRNTFVTIPNGVEGVSITNNGVAANTFWIVWKLLI